MIDLLPTTEKKKIIRNFYFRAVVVSLFMLGIVFVVAAVSLLPAYFFAHAQKNTASANLAKQQAEPIKEVDGNTDKVVTDLNNKMSLIEKAEKEKFLVSQRVINEIIFKKMPDIKLDRIFYQNDTTGKGRVINLSGTAQNRERLLLFKEALESDPNFKNVDLPISNYIKGNNIKFFISLASI